jgi:hypothetical protein
LSKGEDQNKRGTDNERIFVPLAHENSKESAAKRRHNLKKKKKMILSVVASLIPN